MTIEAIHAWALHYTGNPHAARQRLQHMQTHGTPEGHLAERVGAAIALTPHEYRCEHYGDRRNCIQCTATLNARATAAGKKAGKH